MSLDIFVAAASPLPACGRAIAYEIGARRISFLSLPPGGRGAAPRGGSGGGEQRRHPAWDPHPGLRFWTMLRTVQARPTLPTRGRDFTSASLKSPALQEVRFNFTICDSP